jgi:PAS domain S-box-containing protein
VLDQKAEAMSLLRFLSSKLLSHKRSTLGLLLLLIAGFLGNYFRWTLFFDIDFLFGSIAVWLVVCLYGVGWGTVAGFLAGICTYFIWHHPYTTVTFTLEALFVSWLFHRRQQNNIVLLDAIFWLLIGMPLVWLFYAIILHLDPTQAQIILIKQPVNGIFNALVASLLLTYLPVHSWVTRPAATRTLSLEQTLFNWLVAFVFVPTLVLIMLMSHQVVSDIKTAVQADLNDASRYLGVEMRLWYERRLAAVNELARLAAIAPLQTDALQQNIDFTKRTLPDFRHIHVLDKTGNLILDAEHDLSAQREDFGDDQLYFEKVQRSSKPILSSVFVPGEPTASPRVVIGVPIFRNGVQAGAVLGEIDLNRLTKIFKFNAGENELLITLVDQQQTVAASTQSARIGQRDYNWRANGEVQPIGAQTYHRFPTQGSRLVMVRWSNSFFVKETVVSHDIPWSLILEIPAKPHVHQIERVHTRNLALLLLVSGTALIFARLVSRRLVKPLSQLADVTTNLPNKLLKREAISWSQSQITEFSTLVCNFRSMATSLQQMFWEIQQANATLEQRVQERTQALQNTNSELEAEIAERQQAEAALRESEERFRQMAENMQEVFWMKSIHDERILYVSSSYEEVWGRTCESLYAVSRSFLDAIHPDDRDRVMAALPKQVDGEYNLEYRVIQPNGNIRWIWDKAFPIHNIMGEVYRVVGVAQDITERKQSQELLRQQAERERLLGAISLRMHQSLELDEILNITVAEVRQFLQTDRVIIYQFQADWSGIVVVESVAAGWKSILGKQITDTYFAETQGKLYTQGRIQAIEDIYTAGLADCHVELLRQLQVRANLVVPILQGNTLWGLLVAQHCSTARSWQPSEIDFLKQLAIQAAIAIYQSELYRHEQRLNSILEQQVEERTAQLQKALGYEAMLKRITDKVRDSLDEDQILQTAVEELVQGLGVYGCDTALFDIDRPTVTVSHTYTAGMVSCYSRSILELHFSDIYPQLLKGQNLQFCELVFERSQELNGVFACPIIDDQGILGSLRLFRSCEKVFSETEIRLVLQVANQCAIAIRQARLYQATQVQVKALEELNQLKDDFLSTVSHELRTPITNMKMAIFMLQKVNDKERHDRYMEILQAECIREAELINDLLDLQRLASGTKVLELETIHLQEWLAKVIEPFQERTQNRQQTLNLYLPPHLPNFTSDPSCLSRILAELLNNACKYTPPGETISLSVQVSETTELPLSREKILSTGASACSLLPPSPISLKICVCNSGVEIPAHEQPRIFDKFYRVAGSDRWKQGGTGLGLALVQKLTEHLGGTIQVKSANNQTCFILEL